MTGEVNTETSPLQTYSWSEVKGNMFHTQLHLSMLHPEGMVVRKHNKLKTDLRPTELYWMNVKFDREFVVRKLAYTIEPIKQLGWNEIMKLLSEAFKYASKQ